MISFGGNPNIDELFPSLIPLEVTTIVVDGRVAERVNETEFQYE